MQEAFFKIIGGGITQFAFFEENFNPTSKIINSILLDHLRWRLKKE